MEATIKTLTTKVADIDSKQRVVKFYFSAFNSVDSDGDIIRPGALMKSIKENGPQGSGRIRHFLNHEFKSNTTALPIGRILEMGEDNYGGFAVSKIARTKQADDVYTLYEDGMINEHSFGFIPMPGKFKETSTGYEFNEVRILEVSSVTTWAANERTPTIEVKQSREPGKLTPEQIDALFRIPEPGESTPEEEAALKTFYSLLKFNY